MYRFLRILLLTVLLVTVYMVVALPKSRFTSTEQTGRFAPLTADPPSPPPPPPRASLKDRILTRLGFRKPKPASPDH